MYKNDFARMSNTSVSSLSKFTIQIYSSGGGGGGSSSSTVNPHYNRLIGRTGYLLLLMASKTEGRGNHESTSQDT
jgi:hypothetical protein